VIGWYSPDVTALAALNNATHFHLARISTPDLGWDKGMAIVHPLKLHYAQRTSVYIYDGKQRPNASSNLGDP
jgi:hypothetical protein